MTLLEAQNEIANIFSRAVAGKIVKDKEKDV